MLTVGDAHLGRYQLLDVAGAGAFSTVYKAYDPVLERTVAIKLLKAMPSQGRFQHALKEARALATLSHANIVRIFDVSEHDQQAYLVMEYVDGKLLSDRILQAPMPIDEVVEIALSLLDALQAASTRKIFHGDIKPANIILDDDGDPRLLDFGLSKVSNPEDVLATLAAPDQSATPLTGTLPYMAPERILGEPVDHRADLFSLGAVLYEMLTGKRAFDGNTQGLVITQVLNETPEPISKLRPDVPDWLSLIVERLLAKRASERPQSIPLIKSALQTRAAIKAEPARIAGVRNLLRPVVKTLSAYRYPLGGVAALGFGLIFLVPQVSIPSSSIPVYEQTQQGLGIIADFERNSDLSRSRDIFETLVVEQPDNAAARAGLSLALIREYTALETDPSTLRRATGFASDALAKDPHLAIAHIASGWAAEFNGAFDEALLIYDQADRLDPDHPLTLEGRARIYKKQNHYVDAAQVLEKAITLYPDHRIFHDELGVVRFQQGRLTDAAASFRHSMELAPDNPRAYANLGQTLHMQGKTREAISIVQNGLMIESTSQLYNNLGAYLFFQGDYGLSAEAFTTALEFDGNANRYLYWGNLADAYRWTPGKETDAKTAYRTAIRLLKRDLEARPDNQRLNSSLAQYAAKAGDVETAQSALARVAQRPVTSSSVLYRLAVTYEALGDRDRALEMLASAMELGHSPTEIDNDPEFAELRQSVAYQMLISKERKTD